MKEIKLGIIGISKGNGHPYSWSSIFNGYNRKLMRESPYPVIADYLSKQSFPSDAIQGASVTHIWTQDKDTSIAIAKASNIPHVENNFKDMIGKIDALLLARDDSENHYAFVYPFLKAGIPVYIDKPLATNINDARKILDAQLYDWQVFSCSALKYAVEFQLDKKEMTALGKIRYVQAIVPKDWAKYAIHVIDPLSQIISIRKADILNHSVIKAKDICQLSLKLKGSIIVNISSFGNVPSPISILIKGTKSERMMIFKDPFNAFKSSLQTFIVTLNNQKLYIPRNQTLNIIHLIELGKNG